MCFCPCAANAKITAYRKSGDPGAPIDTNTALCNFVLAYSGCGDAFLGGERTAVREKTNVMTDDCSGDRGCNTDCWCACISLCLCWGCAGAQEKLELDVWYGHASENAPVHAGSPAAKKFPDRVIAPVQATPAA